MILISKTIKNQDAILLDRNITDFIKVIACVMVAMSHYSGYVLANDVSSSVVYKAIAAVGGYLGVAIFFFFSGYGLMKSDMKHPLQWRDFLKRCLTKTWLPAVLVSVIWLAVAAAVGLELLCNQRYFLGVVWSFNDEVMWFVRVILIMYCFFYIYRFISRLLQINILLLLIVVIAYFSIKVLDIGSSLSVPLFFLGVAVAEFPKFFRKIGTSIPIIILLLIIAFVIVFFCKHDNYLMHGWINYFFVSLMIILLANYNITLTSLPKWLGGCSYDLYLVHYKTHLLILHYFPIDAIWMFVVGTATTTALFYNLRKLLKL